MAEIVLWFLALAACLWLFIVSVRLMLRGFSRMVAARAAVLSAAALPSPSRPHVAPWAAAAIRRHIETCSVCYAAVADYRAEHCPGAPLEELLDSLEPVTIADMLRVIEREDAPPVVVAP